MAGPYYVDIGAPGAWDTRNGLSSGACWLGLTGLQKAFNTAAAGEIVYIKGTGVQTAFFTVPFDGETGGHLTDGEAVSWGTGGTAGTGVVHWTGADMATPIWIELLTGVHPANDVTITGATSTNSVACNDPADTGVVPITLAINTNAGTNAAGHIRFVGCNSSFAVDGTRAIINVNSAVVDGITATGKDAIWLENIEVYGAGTGKSGFYFASACNSWQFVNCSFHNNTVTGMNAASRDNYAQYYRCAVYANGADGVSNGAGTSSWYYSSIHDNGTASAGAGSGFYYHNGGLVHGCLIYDNSDDGFEATQQGTRIIGCVIDSNHDDGIEIPDAGSATAPVIILGCRITNHSTAGSVGIKCGQTAGENVIVGYTYFNNNADDMLNDTAGLTHLLPTNDGSTDSNSYDATATNHGQYTVDPTTNDGSENYNLTSTSTLRRTGITIPLT